MPLLKNISDNFLNFIFPQTCRGCTKPLNIDENFLCQDCIEKLTFLPKNICSCCEKESSADYCQICNENGFYFDRAISVFHFDRLLKKIIHELKYDEMDSVAKFLVEISYDFLSSMDIFKNIDLICPVPLHRVKKRIRGYNQAERISYHLSKKNNIEHIPDLVLRKRFTKSQTKLNRIERAKNVSQAFCINKRKDVSNKQILIVDDVFTTGATMNSISKVLKEYNVGKVFALTIARA